MLNRGWKYLPAKFLDFRGVAQAYADMMEMTCADEKAELWQTQQSIRASVYDSSTNKTVLQIIREIIGWKGNHK